MADAAQAAAPQGAVPAAPNTTAPAAISPNQTLYLRNLNEKIRLPELKQTLHAMFSQFGPIMDVVAYKTLKMRGQAFVVFKEVASATAAMRAMQGFPFFDKPMSSALDAYQQFIQYAMAKSFAVAKEDGTYDAVKRKRDEEREKEKASGGPKKKAPKTTAGAAAASGAAAPLVAELLPEELMLPPNNILFVQNLPQELGDAAQSTLTALFKQYNGFKEVRLVPGKWNLAFVEYDSDYSAAVAKDALQSFAITPGNLLKITFAKR